MPSSWNRSRGIHRRGKYQDSGGPSFAQVAGLLDQPAGDPAEQLALLAKYMAFTCNIGNSDAHGKNIGLLHDDTGSTQLAPIYDAVPTLLWPTLRSVPAMAIGAAASIGEVNRADLDAELSTWPTSSKTSAPLALDELIDDVGRTEVTHAGLASQVADALNRIR